MFDELPQFATVRDVVIFLLAIYGAGLSTFNLRQAMRREKRRVMVKFNTMVPTYADGSLGERYASIEATNVGHRVVRIETIGWSLPGNRHMFPTVRNSFPGMPDTDLPASLEDGDTARLIMSYADIAGALSDGGYTGTVEITPYCKDTTGKTHTGKPWQFDLNERHG